VEAGCGDKVRKSLPSCQPKDPTCVPVGLAGFVHRYQNGGMTVPHRAASMRRQKGWYRGSNLALSSLLGRGRFFVQDRSSGLYTHLQAIILAGGRGERLRPLTDDRPKPMVEINGQPLIAYELGWLRKNGVNQVVVSCGYRWRVLQDYLGDGSQWELNIRYAVEPQKLGRGGGIRFAMRYLDPDPGPVVVANGDNLLDVGLAPMLARHAATSAMVTVALVPLISVRGIVETDERDRIVRFREKPELPHWINAGVYVFSREMAKLLPIKGDHEDTLFPRLATEGRLYGYKTREVWRTVDTAKDVTEISQELQAGLSAPCLGPPNH
jgi:NDP-sugar pyrophosphorylase family protein